MATAHPSEATTSASDILLTDELLSDAEREARDRVRAFCDREVMPVINGYWERAEFPFELVPGLAALGYAGGTIRGHGCPGLSAVAEGLVHMELARADGSIETFFGVHSGLAMQSIDMLGSDEQRERWLPAMARMDALGAFALTEPDHGSDIVLLETRARRDGGDHVLDGRKRWIGNASFADVVVVWARGEDGEVGGYLVEKGTPGYHAEVITGKTSLRAVWQADITLDGVRVPEANRLPGCETFADVGRVLTRTRQGVAWRALGVAVAAYEAAVAYAAERQSFGRPIASYPARAGQAEPDARRDHGDAAAVPARRPTGRRRPADRGDGVAGQDEPRREGAHGRRRRARHPRRQRHPARQPCRAPPRRHGGRLHLRGHRQHPVADRRARDHGRLGDGAARQARLIAPDKFGRANPARAHRCSRSSGTAALHPETSRGDAMAGTTQTGSPGTAPGNGGAKEQAKEKAQEVKEQAAGQAREAAGQARSRVRDQVDQRSTQAGERVSQSAGDLRSVADGLREQGKEGPAKLAEQVAQRTERAGSYLTESDADRILGDVEDFARSNPWAVAAGGLLVGFAASRVLKASSSRRYEQRSTGQLPPPRRPAPPVDQPLSSADLREPTVTDPAGAVGPTTTAPGVRP